MTFAVALFIAAATGFIALSYEIVWYRVVAFLTWSSPASFGILLGAYLTGIALGSAASGRFCRDPGARGQPRYLRALAAFVFFANVASFFVVPSIAYAATRGSVLWPLVAIAAAAGLMGAILPLLAHFAIAPDDHAGQRLSYLYLANIVGSALGSLITGFVFLDRMTLRQVCVLLALSGFVLGALLWVASRPGVARAAAGVTLAAAACFGASRGSTSLFDRIYERLHYRHFYTGQRFADVVETRSGVITVTQDGVVYGGGAYDGSINTTLTDDRNHVVRIYAALAMHPHPRKVIMIGLSSGSWAQIIANDTQVEHETVIEINPGYLGIIRKYPQVSSLLHDPKVDIQIDDGRRWLLRHPDAKADLFVMNTTWHWRAHSTNLLSREFMEIVRAHLLPGGILFFNTTSSGDVQKTAATVFPYAYRVVNFMAVSDSPFALDPARWRGLLETFRVEGDPVIDTSTEAGRTLMAKLMKLPASLYWDPPSEWGMESRDSVLRRTAHARIVTDDNMAPEFYRPLRFPDPN